MARNTATQPARLLYQLWWVALIQAILAIVFGAVTLFWPQLTLVTLVYLISAFVIAIGLTEVFHGVMSIGRRDTWWMTLIIGLIALGVGVYLARHPEVSFKTFIVVVGITFIARGVISVLRTFFESATTAYKVLDFIVGLAGIGVGIVILAQPVSGGLAFVWVLGLYALVYGILALFGSIEARNYYNAFKDEL
jgi:uncharacterized membrane protein HdeD (DUF308 family)